MRAARAEDEARERERLLGDEPTSPRVRVLSDAQDALGRLGRASVLTGRDLLLMGVCFCLVVAGLYALIKYDDRRILKEVCVTRDCVRTGMHLLHAMDESQDPCDDFFAFATGGWEKEHFIPANKSEVSVFDDVAQEVQRTVARVATQAVPDTLPELDRANLDKIQGWYAACMNTAEQDAQGSAPLVRTVHAAWEHESESLLGWMHAHGFGAWFDISVDGDAGKAPLRATPLLSPGGTGLPSKTYYEEQSSRDAYTRIVELALVRLREAGVDTHADARDIVGVEEALANAAPSPAELQDPRATYHPMSLDELARVAPLDWRAYFAHVAPVAPSYVIVASPSYLAAMHRVWKAASPALQRAYAAWTIARVAGLFLGPHVPLHAPALRLQHMMHGLSMDVKPDQEAVCTKRLRASLGHMVDRYYLEDVHMAPATLAQVSLILDEIRAAFLRRLYELPWLDSVTRRSALAKAARVTTSVGYPATPDPMQARAVAQWYAGLNVSASAYANELNGMAFRVRQAFSYLGRDMDRGVLADMGATDVNAEYIPTWNEIMLAAGILRSPFFDPQWPMYLKFGALGTIAGHELSHAFDPHGRQYNSQGVLSDWWSPATAHAFRARQACIEKQYGAYYVSDAHGNRTYIQSHLTIGEDVADAGGMSQSYRAWKHLLDEGGIRVYADNRRLPGMVHYTQEQLFFLAFAQMWASKMRAEEQVRLVRTDPHSPARFRVNGVLSNFPPFAEAFQCKPGAKMVRPKHERCEIW